MFVYENESGISTRKEPGLQLTFVFFTPLTIVVRLDIRSGESTVGKGQRVEGTAAFSKGLGKL